MEYSRKEMIEFLMAVGERTEEELNEESNYALLDMCLFEIDSLPRVATYVNQED